MVCINSVKISIGLLKTWICLIKTWIDLIKTWKGKVKNTNRVIKIWLGFVKTLISSVKTYSYRKIINRFSNTWRKNHENRSSKNMIVVLGKRWIGWIKT